jgi:hypothetical protein
MEISGIEQTRWTSATVRETTTWTLEFAVPFSVLMSYTGTFGALGGAKWLGNLYKCGDKTSHPHWLSWVPVSELNFHLPTCFKPLIFE